MTTVRKNLLLRKQQLLERLQGNPTPKERDQIEGDVAQIDTALDLLKESGESSDEPCVADGRGFLCKGASACSAAPQAEARFVMDIYDEADWTEMDIEDLKAAIEGGASIEQAAEFLCRADGIEEVARKCAELGLKPKARS